MEYIHNRCTQTLPPRCPEWCDKMQRSSLLFLSCRQRIISRLHRMMLLCRKHVLRGRHDFRQMRVWRTDLRCGGLCWPWRVVEGDMMRNQRHRNTHSGSARGRYHGLRHGVDRSGTHHGRRVHRRRPGMLLKVAMRRLFRAHVLLRQGCGKISM